MWVKRSLLPSHCHCYYLIFLPVHPHCSFPNFFVCSHTAALILHPISWVPRQMFYLYFQPISYPLWADCLLSASADAVLLRLGRADARLCPGANVFNPSKCFHVNSEFQDYSHSQLVRQHLKRPALLGAGSHS